MYKVLLDKRILIGICGGIAAYKILDLIRRLKEHGAQVKVILTAGGKEFVTPLSVQALTGERAYEELLSTENEAAMSHIELARWAQVCLIAPATAHTLAKCAHGLADDLLSTVCLATTAPVLCAPAMNQQMWQHAATKHNISILQQRGVQILGPACGAQACGETGPGRMLEANQLLDHLTAHFSPGLLRDKHILITAGPTVEALDPVRFISNRSSGKMGYALAATALQLGAKVTLVAGPTNLTLPEHERLNTINVRSAADMQQAVMQTINTEKVAIFIGCAAVADYTPVQKNAKKIKKNIDELNIVLKKTPDIITAVANLPAATRPFTIGFAAETEELLSNAQNKLQAKNMDLIIANLVADGKAFDQENNQVTVLWRDGKILELPLMSKQELALRLLSNVCLAETTNTQPQEIPQL